MFVSRINATVVNFTDIGQFVCGEVCPSALAMTEMSILEW